MNVRHLNLNRLAKSLDQPDVFICCGSFEERSRSIPDRLGETAPSHVIVVENSNLTAYVHESTQHIMNTFKQSSLHAVSISTEDPLLTADNLEKSLCDVAADTPLRYVVDITTFTHESLLILLQLIRRMAKPGDEVTFCYCSARFYAVGLSGRDKWLSKGVQEVRSVLGYPGEMLPWQDNHLIILVGYEHERAEKLIEMIEPEEISLGHGTSTGSISRKHYLANECFTDLAGEIAQLYARTTKFTFSCSDPWDAKSQILEQASRTPDSNIIVSPMNTKISTIGSALAAFENPRIQLCYAQARLYNYSNYSRPANQCYVFSLPELTPEPNGQ